MTSTVSTISQLNEWRPANFGTTTNTGPSADVAVDEFGIANIQRYAFGSEIGEPPDEYQTGSGVPGMPTVWIDSLSQRLNVRFVRRMPSTNPEIQYVVEFSGDLLHWVSGSFPAELLPLRGNWEEVRFEQPPLAFLNGRCFVRVRIVRQ